MSDEHWANLKDEDLLKMRVSDLRLKMEDSGLLDLIQRLHQELEEKKVPLTPTIYLGDEWFSPDRVVAISVPFYLAHPRLVALEKRMMLEVEGGSPESFMKLLRHEAGHCFDHAYRFSTRSKWKTLFGPPDKEYNPDTYRPRPYSRSYVRHLDNWYAQAHPDEDFAETFAVWLNPESAWRNVYSDWPVALAKLSYVDRIVQESQKRPPHAKPRYLPCSASRMDTTLERYYQKRKRANAQDYPDFYDEDLKRIFQPAQEASKKDETALWFMRRHQKEIVNSVSYWTGERKYTINGLIKKLIARCKELRLKVVRSEAETNLEVAAYLATLVTHYLFTGKFKRRV